MLTAMSSSCAGRCQLRCACHRAVPTMRQPGRDAYGSPARVPAHASTVTVALNSAKAYGAINAAKGSSAVATGLSVAAATSGERLHASSVQLALPPSVCRVHQSALL